MDDISIIEGKINTYKEKELKIFATSSFQTHSVVMLHLLSRINKSIPVYFMNTGFHFPETVAYKNQVAQLLDINVIDLFSFTPKSLQKDDRGRLLFTSDADRCCNMNKVNPLEPIIAGNDVWITGVRKDQNSNRSDFKLEDHTPDGTIRFHPMINWSLDEISNYLLEYQLPKHPLDEKGYTSIGCEPCTRKVVVDSFSDARQSRWFGQNKTECGLHSDLIKKL